VIELLIIGFDADANAFKWQGGVWMVDGGRRDEATYLPPRAAPLEFATETLYRKY